MVTIIVGLVAAGLAATDWWSVWRGKSHVEQFAKPAVMVALLVLAVSIDADPAASKWLVVIGLLFGLAGDVAGALADGGFV